MSTLLEVWGLTNEFGYAIMAARQNRQTLSINSLDTEQRRPPLHVPLFAFSTGYSSIPDVEEDS
jgi:hypothetical protein